MEPRAGLLAGQTEVVSLVLISGIVIALAGAAYMWGLPLLEKRSASADFAAATNMISEIDRKILSLANAGGGRAEMGLSKPMSLVPAGASDTENNSLAITYATSQPMLGAESDAVIYLGAASFSDISEGSGVFGRSSPGIITVRQSASISGGYVIRSKLRYRELVAPGLQPRVFLISLCRESDAGCSAGATGSTELTLTFLGTETVPGPPDRVVTKIGVRLV